MSENGNNFGFTGKLGFILATAGSAVGLGNLWRFPYLAEQYGGGAFILIYVILAVTFGFTLMIAEVTIGRKTGKSCLEAFGSVDKKWKWVGWLAALVPAIIVPYYCVIGGWVTKYFVEYATGNADAVTSSFFMGFITCDLPGILDNPVVWFIIFSIMVAAVVIVGVDKGIERVSKILMPLLLVLLVITTVFALTMDGAIDGLNYYLVPKVEDITAGTFLGAIGQLFYSMSLAMGITITYGAYMKKDVDIEKSVRSISLIDTGVALLAGLMIVPAVVAIGEPGTKGVGLMFMTLPKVFEAMPFGEFVAAIFFLLVIFAALTSAISLMETLVYVLMDKAHMKRVPASIIVFVGIIALGLLSCLGFGPLGDIYLLKDGFTFLDFFDFISNSILMPIVAIATCVFIGFIVGPRFITDEVESSGGFRSKKMFVVFIKWICPIALALILVTGLLDFFGIFTI
ncbi:MAG: sodium-dependent transporter [Candidatus Methanomethylophilaceae archaeon]